MFGGHVKDLSFQNASCTIFTQSLPNVFGTQLFVFAWEGKVWNFSHNFRILCHLRATKCEINTENSLLWESSPAVNIGCSSVIIEF